MKLAIHFAPETAQPVEIRRPTIYDGRLFWPVTVAILAIGLLAGWLAVN